MKLFNKIMICSSDDETLELEQLLNPKKVQGDSAEY